MPTYLASHADFQRHLTGADHPERPERLAAIHCVFDAMDIWRQTIPVHGAAVDDATLLTCHSPAHLAAVAAACASAAPITHIDDDTVVGPDSDRIARLAVGHILAACDAVMADPTPNTNAFCLTRPPGHHATRDRPMGFCLYGNVALAARHLQRVHGLRRVLIIDWDVHHGNGTEDILYDDPDSFFISTHQYPFYPHTGHPDRRGHEKAHGLTLNIPLAAGTGHAEAIAVLADQIIPVARDYNPEFILISAGFDAHARDPLSMLQWRSETYAVYTDAITQLAFESDCHGIVSVLEGGYDLVALADAALLHLRRLLHASQP